MNPYTSYASANGFEVIDWAVILEIAPSFSEDEKVRYDSLASEWNTCAVGQTSHLIERGSLFHSPQVKGDPRLGALGCDFSEAFISKDFEAAKKALEEIKEVEKELVG